MIERRKNRSTITHKAGKKRNPLVVLIGVALVFVVALIVGGYVCFDILCDIHDARCRIVDADYDVVITTGRMVSSDVIVTHFGLTNGANLARIDFIGQRAKLLSRVPNVRDLRIERRMPNRVTVEVIEREPVARVVGKVAQMDGRVADVDGVVFIFARDTATATLPIIREEAYTKPGERLKEMASAGLRLVSAVSSPKYYKLNVQEIDVTRPDYLVLTLGDCSRAKIAWDHMLEDSHTAQKSLELQLTRLQQAMKSDVAAGTRFWNATDWGTPGYVYANDPVRAL